MKSFELFWIFFYVIRNMVWPNFYCLHIFNCATIIFCNLRAELNNYVIYLHLKVCKISVQLSKLLYLILQYSEKEYSLLSSIVYMLYVLNIIYLFSNVVLYIFCIYICILSWIIDWILVNVWLRCVTTLGSMSFEMVVLNSEVLSAYMDACIFWLLLIWNVEWVCTLNFRC
jgi:hypothetical protein